jgi:hypothetical protein
MISAVVVVVVVLILVTLLLLEKGRVELENCDQRSPDSSKRANVRAISFTRLNHHHKLHEWEMSMQDILTVRRRRGPFSRLFASLAWSTRSLASSSLWLHDTTARMMLKMSIICCSM